MDLDAVRAGDKAKDIVPKNRIAAAGHLVVQALDVARIQHQDIFLGLKFPGRFCRRLSSLRGLNRLCVTLLLCEDELLDGIGRKHPLPYGRIEERKGGIAIFLAEFRVHIVREFQLPVA